MKRRDCLTVLWASIANFFIGWRWGAASEAEKKKSLFDGGPKDGLPELSRVPDEKMWHKGSEAVHHGLPLELKDHKFLVVHGGSFPLALKENNFGKYGNALIRPCKTRPALADTYPEDTMWFEVLPREIDERTWPRAPCFAVTHEVKAGTIDQLVDEYRQQLIRCAERIAGTPDKRPPGWEDRVAFQGLIEEKWSHFPVPWESASWGSLLKHNEPESVAYDKYYEFTFSRLGESGLRIEKG